MDYLFCAFIAVLHACAMVNKCVAYGCKSGYKSNDRKDVTFHSFPKDQEMCYKWIRANPRKDFVLSKHSRLCSLHFTDSDKVGWIGTADFIGVVLKLWNVLNVKTSSKGKNKRDATMDPIRSSL
jgi:hypothetical protein